MGNLRFNPRTPCGVRLKHGMTSWRIISFNPRTPCGVRHYFVGRFRHIAGFQSTHSLRSATRCSAPRKTAQSFQSTHSLRSATQGKLTGFPRPAGFNPRTPCGVRRTMSSSRLKLEMFQSTHSLRSATLLQHLQFQSLSVSIHALLAECDRDKPPA